MWYLKEDYAYFGSQDAFMAASKAGSLVLIWGTCTVIFSRLRVDPPGSCHAQLRNWGPRAPSCDGVRIATNIYIC